MSKPLVSAMIPTYKRAELVGTAINAVLAQSWRPLELIVINDGSGDNTQEVLESFRPAAEKAGVAYQCVETPNGGPGKARPRALLPAQGEGLA